MHRRDQEKIAVQCVLELERMGLSVEVIQDFERIPELMERLGRPLGVANDPRTALMTQTNSFWIVGSRKQEVSGQYEPLIGCGVRVDDLGDEDVEAFISRSLQVLFGVRVTGVSADIFAGTKWGRAAYVGALTSSLTIGLGRSARKSVQLLMAYAHFRAMTDLNADVNYCFLRDKDASKGVTYGFLSADSFVWKTDRDIFNDGNPGWLMSTSNVQMPSLMLAASKLFSDRLSIDEQSGQAS